MDPITVTLIGAWAFNAGAAIVLIGKKFQEMGDKLEGINAAFEKMDLSADWAENISDESGD